MGLDTIGSKRHILGITRRNSLKLTKTPYIGNPVAYLDLSAWHLVSKSIAHTFTAILMTPPNIPKE